MDEQLRTAMLKEIFNTVSEGYDKKALRFFPNSALHMAALLGLRGDEHVLDVAVCAFGIFFVEDMDTQLARIASTIKHGGRIMISNFQESYFHPLKEKLASRITTYGVQVPPQTWKRIAHEQGCRELFEKAGLANIAVDRKNVGYYLDSAGQWWDVVWNAGFRRMVGQLSPSDQEQFKREHLQEVEALRTKDGIRLDVGVLYTSGTKPERSE